MAEQTPLPAQIDERLALAARGILPADVDEAWEPVLLAVTRRGVVTAADRRAAARLLAAEEDAAPGA